MHTGDWYVPTGLSWGDLQTHLSVPFGETFVEEAFSGSTFLSVWGVTWSGDHGQMHAFQAAGRMIAPDRVAGGTLGTAMKLMETVTLTTHFISVPSAFRFHELMQSKAH